MPALVILRRVGLASLLALAATPLAAQQLDPRVAMPLSQLIEAYGGHCQAGNPQACGMVQRLQQAGQELTQAQFACQQGNPQACQVFQSGAQEVGMAWQQAFGGGQPASPQQSMWDHQQRMQQQQMQFQQHQDRMAQQRMMQDEQHRRFMEQLRR